MSIAIPWRSIRVRVRHPEVEVSVEYIRARRLLRNIIGASFMVLFTLIPGILAEDSQFRAFMLLLSFCLSLFFIGMFSAHLVPRRGILGVQSHEQLTFEASRLPDLIVLSSFLLGGVAGIIAVISSMQPGSYLSDSTIGRFSPWLLIPVAIFAIFDQARRGLKPRGITLTKEGIHWRDLKHDGTVAWKDLESVELGAQRGVKRLYLHEYGYGGDLHIIEPSGLGSDPIVIAEVIDYFRRHPRDRQKLHDPQAALALVTEPIGEQP